MPRPPGIDSSNTLASKSRISLRADIDKLMEYFLLTESVRYQEFAKVWQAFNFALIYAGLKDSKEKKDFIQDAFELVSEFLQPPFDLQRRVCALYTLYGLYYTQTHNPRIKIRMSLENWKETLALHDDLQEQGHLDALYIFHKMRLDKAFMFTATHTPMFYQMRSKKPEDFEKWAAKHQGFMASVLDEDLLQELEQVHKGYQNDKHTLNLQDDPSMGMVEDSMSEFVMERISNIDVPREAEESEALAESRSRASRIREIKKRSFASPTRASKARRSRSGLDSSETDDDPTYNPTAGSPVGRGRKKQGRRKVTSTKSGSNSSMASPKMRKKRQASTDKGESNTSLSSPRRKKPKDASSDASPNVEGKGRGKKNAKPSTNKSQNVETLEPLNEADEPVDQIIAEEPRCKKKTSKKKKESKDGRKIKQKLSSKDKSESTKKKDSKKKSSKDKHKGSKRASKSKDKDGKSKKTKSKKTPTEDSSPKSQKASKDSKQVSPPDSTETVNVKVETPSNDCEGVEESPRKRPRKSNSPRRLTRSQESSSNP